MPRQHQIVRKSKMKATLKNYRQSPRKVGRVADKIRGKSVAEAELELMTLTKRASLPMLKVLRSAVANAVHTGVVKNDSELRIGTIEVGKGITFGRSRPRARGSSAPINKHTSHISIQLSQVESKKSKGKDQKSKVKSKMSKIK